MPTGSFEENRILGDGNEQHRAKRRRAIRTALVLGGVVLLIYIGFIMKGVLNAA